MRYKVTRKFQNRYIWYMRALGSIDPIHLTQTYYSGVLQNLIVVGIRIETDKKM